MKKRISVSALGFIVLAISCVSMSSCSREIEVNEKIAPLQTDAELIGVLAPKSLAETDNDLTIGCETLDRDYADYHKYKEYLEQLGVRKIRLMAGWAKTEQEKGVYDFAWLDSIIDDAVSRGLEPWLETSYGNPIYEGGGTKFLAGGWPTSPEAIEAWDRWVEAMAVRYKGKVHEWEIWNEPDINKDFKKDVSSQVDLQIRTAEIIRRVDPEAKIAGFAWAGWKKELFEQCMTQIQERGKLGLFDWISYHIYRYRPEDMYELVDQMRASLDNFSKDIILRQGETGAPSKGHLGGALSEYEWSEISQAKWDLRRMLSDHGKGIATTVFSISDMNYQDKDLFSKKNVKGILETDDNNNILRPKQAYYAIQNLVSVYDALDGIVSPEGIEMSGSDPESSFSIYRFRDSGKGMDSVVLWEDSSTPDDCTKAISMEITVPDAALSHPVCVDVRTGNVYRIRFKRQAGAYVFSGVPVYDSPVIITDRSLLKLK